MTRVLINLIDFIITHLYIAQTADNVKSTHEVVLELEKAKQLLADIQL